MSELFRIENGALVRAARSRLANEVMIQDWVRDNLGLVGISGVVIGREVTIANRGRIDLLAMDKDGSLIIIELKRDRTPREIVAQVLDYASWVVSLSTRDVHALCLEKTGRTLDETARRAGLSIAEARGALAELELLERVRRCETPGDSEAKWGMVRAQ